MYMYVCVCVCVCVYIYIYIYIHNARMRPEELGAAEAGRAEPSGASQTSERPSCKRGDSSQLLRRTAKVPKPREASKHRR